MKTIVNYIKESIDLDNLFWKIDTWFANDQESKNEFIALVAEYKASKANRQDIENYVVKHNFNIKEFVNFMDEDIQVPANIDYIYQLCKIIDLINANKSKKLK